MHLLNCKMFLHFRFQKIDDTINLYPVGVIVNPYSYWLATTPDRKVYCPDRNPPYGLLEIKCPVVDDINDAKCLQYRDGQ